jgi:hypothetical protein
METIHSQIEPVTMSEVLELASWDRPRTSNELLSFIALRESKIENL